MNVAFCFFGNIGRLRGFRSVNYYNYPPIDIELPARHFEKYVLDANSRHNIGIFCHSSSYEFSSQLEKLFNPLVFEFKENPFPEPKEGTNLNKIRDRYVARSRFYSQRRVLELKSEYERDNYFKYDLVCLLRYDLVYFKDIILDNINPEKFNIQYNKYEEDAFNNVTRIGDWFFASSSSEMNRFGKAFWNIDLLKSRSGFDRYDHHSMCLQQLKLMYQDKYYNNIDYILHVYFDHIIYKLISNKNNKNIPNYILKNGFYEIKK